jgi:nanoRNase/pAp phosphatase (c-di-AMP/oligoRNAs hydrolase)
MSDRKTVDRPLGESPAMATESEVDPVTTRRSRSERFLETIGAASEIILVSHVNPDPDALASMLGLEALVRAKLPDKAVTLTVDGIIARAENQAMVDFLQIPLIPVEGMTIGPNAAMVMVDTQPHTGRRASEAVCPVAVLDHHETPGSLDGVRFIDIRPQVGATSTIVTGYLLEQGLAVPPRLATALLYGIESETTGYPREAGPSDDGALVWLFPRADKDLLARIRNPKLPQSYFATYQNALTNAFLFGAAVVCWCGDVPHPDIVAELADFFVRFDQVDWALSAGQFEGMLKLSLRSSHIGGHCGELLRAVVESDGNAGGHDRRAGGAVPVSGSIDEMRRVLLERFLRRLKIDAHSGRRLLEASPLIFKP